MPPAYAGLRWPPRASNGLRPAGPPPTASARPPPGRRAPPTDSARPPPGRLPPRASDGLLPPHAADVCLLQPSKLEAPHHRPCPKRSFLDGPLAGHCLSAPRRTPPRPLLSVPRSDLPSHDPTTAKPPQPRPLCPSPDFAATVTHQTRRSHLSHPSLDPAAPKPPLAGPRHA
nr:lysine-rich arabinogalactan protein 19-like [Aegilops tauschii subsp. strangulata]